MFQKRRFQNELNPVWHMNGMCMVVVGVESVTFSIGSLSTFFSFSFVEL